MHTAKELHDRLLPMNFRGTEQWSLNIAANADTILRALSLLSSVEDGEGVVLELTEAPAVFNEYGTSIDISGDTLDKAAARITLDAQEKAALKGQADVLDALNTSQAHEIALLKTKLASVKAERDALERVHDDIMQAVGECGSYKP